jgi:tetratricopeptide (TPR) repeat protein
MSDARQEQHRSEATIVPVRRPQSAEGTAGEPTSKRRSGTALMGVGAVILLAALVFVFAYLPNRVDEVKQERKPDSDVAAAVPADPAPPRLSAREREALRAEAEEYRFQLLEQREELNARSAASWGAALWEAYESQARLGDDAMLADQLPEAVRQYEMALASGEQLFEASQQIMAEAQAAGDDAIAAGNPELAMNQFSLVLAVDPDNAAALNGYQRAQALPDLLEAMRRGDQLSREGDLEGAAAAYRQALAIDANWAAARTALAEVSETLDEGRFDALLAAGFAALDEGRLDTAIASFSDAIAMRPDSQAARDGIAQAEEKQLLNSIVMSEVRGMAFERREMWDEAMSRYREALEVDPTLSFAIEGLDRAQSRSDLASKLDALIASPSLLLSEAVLDDAEKVLAEARAIEDPGPNHQSKTQQLAALIDVASTPITVTIVSDNLTEVTVYRVDELGTFSTKELKLKPGRYTAIGARRGYRDVRQQFTVLPGRENGPITVVCVEPI